MKKILITECSVENALTQIDELEGINPKNKNCLRLLAEEMFSMCKELLHVKALDFEIENKEGTYNLKAVTKAKVDLDTREEFLSMSSTGKNKANKGIKGMMGCVLEALFVGMDPAAWGTSSASGMYMPSGDYTKLWSLSHYMEITAPESVSQEWDGMEKSIIATFADDVAIGVRSGMLEMIVKKTF